MKEIQMKKTQSKTCSRCYGLGFTRNLISFDAWINSSDRNKQPTTDIPCKKCKGTGKN